MKKSLNWYRNSHVRDNLIKSRFFHRMREKLRLKLSRGGKVSRSAIIKYKLRNSRKFENIGKYYNQIIPSYNIDIPEVFSFIEAPKETQVFFKKLKKKLNHSQPYSFFISHEKCKSIDLAASFLFDQLIKDEQNYWKKFRVKINLSGRISFVSKHVNNFLLSFGLLSDLGLLNANFGEKQIDYDYRDKYYTFIKKGNKKKSYLKGNASWGLVEYFDNCFKHNNLQLQNETKLELAGRIGEIIGNAEEHSRDEEGKWYALGCYDKEERECSFAIINYGYSIYETLSDKTSTAAEVIEKIADIINHNKSFIEKTGSMFDKFQEEPLWCVMALQDGISSKRTYTGKGRTHGHGIMDVLSFIDFVKSDAVGANVCIVSGHAAIMIDYIYPIIEREIGLSREKRRMIIFNDERDLKQPPDPQKVFSISDNFQGTIFAGRFIIDEKYLINKTGVPNE